MMPLNRKSFERDARGKTFKDVSGGDDVPFAAALEFFASEERVRRMEESELHHGRPALAGVIVEFEEQEEIRSFFEARQPRDTVRFRQAVGIMTRIVMIEQGWEKTGIKGSLGTRSASYSETQGVNTGGLSKWFARSERYRPAENTEGRQAWDRRNLKG